MAAGERCLPGGPKVGVAVSPSRGRGAATTAGISSRGCAVGGALVLDEGRVGMVKGRSQGRRAAEGAAAAPGGSATGRGTAPARPEDSAGEPARVASSSSGLVGALKPKGGGSAPFCAAGDGHASAAGAPAPLESSTAVAAWSPERVGWA